MGKTIVVIGGSYAGIGISHSLLRDTLVKVPDLKVILVSTTTHAYMSLASPRGIIPGQIGDDRLFAPMAPGFSKYPAGSFELVIGKAEKVDDGAKNFAVRTEDGKETVISYDILVIATGASTGSNTAWKQSGSFEDMKKILADTRELVKNAASIAVGGGGSSGVEIAGELGFEYMDTKEITLITSAASLLAEQPAGLGVSALYNLKYLKVDTILNTKITSTKVLANGKTELALSDKTTKVVDLYLPALGVTPNSSILPSSWLNERGYVKVDDFLAVKGVSDNTVYAIGDVADIDVDTRVAAGDQAEAAGRVIHALLTDGEPPAKYVKALNAGATVVGRSKAVGHFNGWGIPSIMLWWIKGRYMWTDKLAQLVEFGTYH